VLVTRRDRAAEKATGVEKFTSDTILRNARVLAIDQAIDEKAGTKTVIGKTATLELTEQQAETLQLSKQLGTISLTLRSILDSQGAAEGGEDNKQGSINTVRFGVSTLGTSR
jgi:pilus assembly protein CpaB